MKSKLQLILLLMFMLSFASCIETHLISTIHRDGSITRQLIVWSDKKDFPRGNIPFPLDTSWVMDTTWELADRDGRKDTVTWILTATKDFPDVEEINEEYRNDQSSSNRELQRRAALTKRFMWFITGYRFSERIENILEIDCPISDFLDEEELNFFYLPEKAQTELKNGIDSLHFKKLSEDMEEKSEVWLWTVLFREWTNIFYDHFGGHPDLTISKEEISAKEKGAIMRLMEDSDEAEDDMDDFIWLFGEEQFKRLESEIDSSMDLLEERIDMFWTSENYGMEIRMPGRIVASNGYADTRSDSINGGGILWTVRTEYFFNQPFEMWAESRANNYWAWIVTGIFVLFVLTGFLIRSRNGK